MISFLFIKVSTVAGQTTVHGRLALKAAQIKALAMQPEKLETGPAQTHLPQTEVMTASELKLITKFAISMFLVVSKYFVRFKIQYQYYLNLHHFNCLRKFEFIFHYHLQLGTVRGTIGVRGDSVPPRVVLVLWKEIASKTLLKLIEPVPDNQHRQNLAIWVIAVS